MWTTVLTWFILPKSVMVCLAARMLVTGRVQVCGSRRIALILYLPTQATLETASYLSVAFAVVLISHIEAPAPKSAYKVYPHTPHPPPSLSHA